MRNRRPAVFGKSSAVFLPAALLWAVILCCLPQASAQIPGARYHNLVNDRFATISDGTQSSIVVDVPHGASADAERALIQSSLKGEWRTRAAVLSPQLTSLRRAGILKKRGVLPVSTLITVRRDGRMVIPPMKHTRAFGGGSLTFTYTNFADTDKAFLQQFVAKAYPLLVDLYGAPASSGTVEVVNVGSLDTSTISEVQRLAFGGYDASNNRILLPVFDNVDSFAHAFLLNLIHAFHGPAVFQYDAWEQGFARAAAEAFIDKYNGFGFGFQDPTANGLYSLLPYYDLLNQPALGNSTFFPPSQANLPLQGQFTIGKMLIPRLGMSGAAWLKVYIENPGFFQQFNAAYYAQVDPTAQPSLAGNVPALRAIAAPLLPNGVEGIPWDAWYEQQYVLDTSVSIGSKLFAFVVPSANDATNGQSASITLVYFRGEPTGDETLLSGQGYATYFDASNARVNLGTAAEQAQIVNGEGNVTTLAFPTPGFDAGRITMDFHAGSAGTRTYLPSGFSGDFQAVVLGPNASGSVNIAQTTLAPVQSRSKDATLENGGLGVGLGTNSFELGTTVVTINNGGVTETHRFNTGDGQYYAVVRRGLSGGGVVTLTHSFTAGAIPNLVTFPVRPLQTFVEQALGLPGSDFLLSYWDPTRPGYETVVAGQPRIAPLQLGRGYWLKLEPASLAPSVSVSVTGIAPATDTDFTVSCAYGWNMVGSPFNIPVDIGKVLVQYLQNDAISWDDAVTRSLVAKQPFGWDPATSSYQTTNLLDGSNWQGYWVRVLVPNGVTLILPGPDSPTSRAVNPLHYVSRSTTAQAAAHPDWSVRLRAAMPGGAAAQGMIGAARDVAAQGFDNRYDSELPPAIVPTMGISFPHADWGRATGGRYVQDFRRVESLSRATWDMVVDTPTAGAATLTWDNLGTVPRHTRLTLFDRAANVHVALRSRSAYTWSGVAGQSRSFQIIAEPERSMPLAISGIAALPTRAVAGGGRGGSMNISFVVNDAAQISVDMASLSGRTVRRLDAGRAAANDRYTVHWDGRAVDGGALPPGPYNLTITARADDGTVVRRAQPVVLLQ